MREIKFRSWDKKEKQMTYFTLEQLIDSIGFEYVIPENLIRLAPIPIGDRNNKIRMQFTGLLDKNGKEIYEGDILEVHRYGLEEKHRTVVRFESGGFILEDDFGEAVTIGWAIDSWDDDGHKYSVIGNIHENSELLKARPWRSEKNK